MIAARNTTGARIDHPRTAAARRVAAYSSTARGRNPPELRLRCCVLIASHPAWCGRPGRARGAPGRGPVVLATGTMVSAREVRPTETSHSTGPQLAEPAMPARVGVSPRSADRRLRGTASTTTVRQPSGTEPADDVDHGRVDEPARYRRRLAPAPMLAIETRRRRPGRRPGPSGPDDPSTGAGAPGCCRPGRFCGTRAARIMRRQTELPTRR